jgi:hypothetical protein
MATEIPPIEQLFCSQRWRSIARTLRREKRFLSWAITISMGSIPRMSATCKGDLNSFAALRYVATANAVKRRPTMSSESIKSVSGSVAIGSRQQFARASNLPHGCQSTKTEAAGGFGPSGRAVCDSQCETTRDRAKQIQRLQRCCEISGSVLFLKRHDFA